MEEKEFEKILRAQESEIDSDNDIPLYKARSNSDDIPLYAPQK
jgi:hypothetical protein